MKLTFLGAAREVTGSCYLIETDRCRFLVDCGMVQGGRDAPARNHKPFDFDPRAIDFVLLTHAHIDHSGLLPKLALSGFTGPVYTTSATADLLAIMLPDSGHIQEMEAERAQRRRRPDALPPIYTVTDAKNCLDQIQPIAYDERFAPHASVSCCFRDAGHILGSAIIEIWVTEGAITRKLVASGDLGQPGRPILKDPTLIEEADVLLIESTYGDRNHKDLPSTLEELAQIVEHTLHQRKGNVIVPAFAVGRTQELIYHLHQLTEQGRLSHLNIFVDSPMAVAVTKITQKHFELFDAEARRVTEWHALKKNLPTLNFVADVSESMALNQIRSCAIIISASGMCDAGRIKHHLRHNLGRPECSVLITGFQAKGTLGRRLVDGDKEVRIFGEDITVRASIHTLGGFSAHADQRALLAWTAGFRKPPGRTFVVHGEAAAASNFAQQLRARNNWTVDVPEIGQSYLL
ncbi:MBL fold metallo-hydrolase RNA specificity domain-containing protein [Rhodoferax sp.]|uniref:MBL fold metallo-hydrolase RNA specificity domain-containing protein n=1 Tax=Rhodoferax sp. TaxID=50421 RepID=UPI0027452012|nr:MBL fold metallo-hydrolase [Rhodoferax sp.]